MAEALVVYGFGAVGRGIVDDLLAANICVELILDRGKRGQTYRNIPILSLDDVTDGRLAGVTVLIGLHNHYVDIKKLHSELIAVGASKVLTPIDLRRLIPDAKTRPGYWLDGDFDYAQHSEQFANARNLLADGTSRDLLDAIVAYRTSGNIAECPSPSLDDEYVPADLPRLPEPLRLIDGGAFTGVAIHKFLKAGYPLHTVVAFEPDPTNFAVLASRNFDAARSVCLPLGLWSTTRTLRFAGSASMGSHLSTKGDTFIQCVAVDDILKGEDINVVKLDVEGAEIEALTGMRQTIERLRPTLLVSAYHHPSHLYAIIELIASWNLNYRFHLRVHEHNTFGTVVYVYAQ